MLEGKEKRAIVRRENRAAALRALGCSEELPRQRPALARHVAGIEPVGDARRGLAGPQHGARIEHGDASGILGQALRDRVRLAPGAFVRVTFATGVAANRDSALTLVRKYRDGSVAARAFSMAAMKSISSTGLLLPIL